MSKKLGEILLSRNLIAPAHLEEGLQAQLVNGTRIGTALVQMGAVHLDEVGRALSIQHGVPVVEQQQLDRVTDEILNKVSLDLVTKHVVVPMMLDGQVLHVAMRDPLRQIAGELSFTLRHSIRRYVAPELRMMYLLEKFYGVQRDPRFLREHTEQRMPDDRRTYMHPTIQAEAEAPAQEEWAESMELVYLDQYDNGQADGPISKVSTGSVVMALRQIDLVAAKLMDASTGEAIAKLLVEPVLDNTHNSLLFWIRGDSAVGCWSHNVQTTLEKLQRLVVPLNTPSVLQWAHQMKGVVRGDAEKDQLHLKILEYLNLPVPGEVCVAPVILNEKVVNLVCTHSHPGQAFTEEALADLKQLTDYGTRAYQRLVQRMSS